MTLLTRSNKKKEPTMISDEVNFKIYGFMRSHMALEKTELLTFALIYSFFRSGASFTASREYISEWTGSGHTAVDNAISSLISKGYITKHERSERGIKGIEYCIRVENLPSIPMHRGMLELLREDERRNRREGRN